MVGYMLVNKERLIVTSHTDENMAITQLKWVVDDKNNAKLSWNWPFDSNVKLLVVFEFDEKYEKIPDIETLLKIEHPHEAVVRDLGADFSKPISEGRRKFVLYPGYFENNQVALYKPAYETDWMFKKTVVNTAIFYKPLAFGGFKQVSMRVSSSDSDILTKALSYTICKNGQVLGKYPLDNMVMSGKCHFFIPKDQTVNFSIDENYKHLIELQ